MKLKNYNFQTFLSPCLKTNDSLCLDQSYLLRSKCLIPVKNLNKCITEVIMLFYKP